jgi:hypothetical protein
MVHCISSSISKVMVRGAFEWATLLEVGPNHIFEEVVESILAVTPGGRDDNSEADRSLFGLSNFGG